MRIDVENRVVWCNSIEQRYETPKADTKINVEEHHNLNVVSRLLSGKNQ